MDGKVASLQGCRVRVAIGERHSFGDLKFRVFVWWQFVQVPLLIEVVISSQATPRGVSVCCWVYTAHNKLLLFSPATWRQSIHLS